MPTLVAQPTRIRAAGTKPKLIDEFIGRVNTRLQESASPTCAVRRVGKSPDRHQSLTNSRSY